LVSEPRAIKLATNSMEIRSKRENVAKRDGEKGTERGLLSKVHWKTEGRQSETWVVVGFTKDERESPHVEEEALLEWEKKTLISLEQILRGLTISPPTLAQ